MHPHLEVHCEVKPRRSQGGGTLQVEVTNSGRVAAHNVHGWISFHKDFFVTARELGGFGVRTMPLYRVATAHWGAIFDDRDVPDEAGWYTAHIYENDAIIVSARRSFDINVTLKRSGKTPVRCRVVCDEGATFDGTLEVEVPGRS